jgi:hypothetical protein
MSLYLICFLVVGHHSNHSLPRESTVQCEYYQADKMSDSVLEEMLYDAAVRHDACETPVVSVKKVRSTKK